MYSMNDPDFIRARTSEMVLENGRRVAVRPVEAGDQDRLREGLTRTSPESRYLRFLRSLEFLTEREAEYLTDLDYRDHFAWGAIDVDAEGQPGLGVARYVRDATDPEAAEAAVLVVDEVQGMGIGKLLMRLLAESAQQNGIRRFTALVSAENRAVLESLSLAGASLEFDGPDVKVAVPLPLPDELFPGSTLRETLRAVARGQRIDLGDGSAARGWGRP